MGVEISCDSSTVYFGDASNDVQIEVFSIGSNGELSEINDFIDTHGGVDSSSLLLSPDETTLYVGNNLSGQITALSVAPGGNLSYGSTTTLNGFIFTVLGLAMIPYNPGSLVTVPGKACR